VEVNIVYVRTTFKKEITMIGFLEKREKISKEMAELNYELYKSNKFLMPLGLLCKGRFIYNGHVWQNREETPTPKWRRDGLAVEFLNNFRFIDDGRDTPFFNFARKFNDDLEVFKSIPFFKNTPSLRNLVKDPSAVNFHDLIVSDGLVSKFYQAVMPGINASEDFIFDLSMTIDGNDIVIENLNLGSTITFVSCLLESVYNKYCIVLKDFKLFNRNDSNSIESFRCFFSATEDFDYTIHEIMPLQMVDQTICDSINDFLEIKRTANGRWFDGLMIKHKLFPEQALASFEITTKSNNIESFMI
jgi:hypothetical protein